MHVLVCWSVCSHKGLLQASVISYGPSQDECLLNGPLSIGHEAGVIAIVHTHTHTTHYLTINSLNGGEADS